MNKKMNVTADGSKIAALIVAGGVGARAGGGLPKQYQLLNGKPMICHSIAAFLNHPDIAQIQVVIHPEHVDLYHQALEFLPSPLRGGQGRGALLRQHMPLSRIEQTQEHARTLRQSATEAEKILWQSIRQEELGVKFRRQAPLDSYVVDFICLERRLIIELDGGQHTEEKDRTRTKYLESQGFRILRFWNHEVIENLEGVLETILQELLAPPPGLPRKGGGTRSKLLPPIHGGAARTDSVRAGLEALTAHVPDYVLIHDAARPFLSAVVIDRLIDALPPLQSHPRAGGKEGEVGVVPCLKVVDTMRRYSDGKWDEVARDGLLRMQTPQAFPFAALSELYGVQAPRGLSASMAVSADAANAHQPPQTKLASPTDDAALWLAAGRALKHVEGEEQLKKMTTAEDITQAKIFAPTRVAVGMGFDVHELMPSGKGVMRIGGIDIPSAHKTHGHSDADVALHAIVDALLGTIADGDIGAHYSPKDARWAGADSAIFLADTLAKVKARGGRIQHVDLTIICEAPKIGPHRDAMRARIAELLEVPLSYVSVKATTTERLGFTGRGEGIAAQAVATVILPESV